MKDKISKPGYLKQRMKLNPKAFLELMRFHTTNFYKDTTSVTKWKGHIVLATDGSSCNVPLTKENVEIYGNTSKHGRKERPQISISCLFDVVNRMVIDINTGMCKLDERTEALRHIDRTSQVVGTLQTVYVCHAGNVFYYEYEKTQRTKSGYLRKTSVYKCENCSGCPYKEKCIKKGNSKTPIEERHSIIYMI